MTTSRSATFRLDDPFLLALMTVLGEERIPAPWPMDDAEDDGDTLYRIGCALENIVYQLEDSPDSINVLELTRQLRDLAEQTGALP